MAPADPTPTLPDYVLDPNAVLKDSEATWRDKRVPDYTKTRAFYRESKSNFLRAGFPNSGVLGFASVPDLERRQEDDPRSG